MKLIVKSEKKCMNCGASNKGESGVNLYYCPVHKKIFCNSCMNPHKANRFNEVAKCHKRYYIGDFHNSRYFNEKQDNCIYQLIPIIENEKEVENGNN